MTAMAELVLASDIKRTNQKVDSQNACNQSVSSSFLIRFVPCAVEATCESRFMDRGSQEYGIQQLDDPLGPVNSTRLEPEFGVLAADNRAVLVRLWPT